MASSEKTCKCPNCSAANRVDYTFCWHCRACPGSKSSRRKVADPAPKKRAAKKKKAA